MKIAKPYLFTYRVVAEAQVFGAFAANLHSALVGMLDSVDEPKFCTTASVALTVFTVARQQVCDHDRMPAGL
jgi:hypothetical protein